MEEQEGAVGSDMEVDDGQGNTAHDKPNSNGASGAEDAKPGGKRFESRVVTVTADFAM